MDKVGLQGISKRNQANPIGLTGSNQRANSVNLLMSEPKLQKRWIILPLALMALIGIMSSGVIFDGEFTQVVGSWLPIENGVERFRAFWEVWWWVFVKGFHVLEFVLLTWLLHSGIHKALKQPFEKSLRLAIAAAVIFAFFDEYHQFYIPGRGARITDFLTDCLGIAITSLWLQLKAFKPSPSLQTNKTSP